MDCRMVKIDREPKECIEEKCYFWDEERKKCMPIKNPSNQNHRF